jgi:hypothetical protein
MTMSPHLKAAQLHRTLARLYRFERAVMPLGDFLRTVTVTRKSSSVQTHTTRRVHLEYRELHQLRMNYTLWYSDGERETGLDVPKCVWDSYAVPDITSNQPAPSQPGVETE